MRRKGARAQQVTRQVDGQHGVPVVHAHVRQAARTQHTGVVDQHITSPQLRQHVLRRRVHIGFRRCVAGHSDGSRAQGGQFSSDFFAPGRITVQQRDLGAHLRQAARDGSADAAGGACHGTHFALQFKPMAIADCHALFLKFQSQNQDVATPDCSHFKGFPV